MEHDPNKKYYDVESQYGDHNTGVKGFNDALKDIFEMNIHKERPPTDRWEQLKRRIDAELSWNVHYSLEKPIEHNAVYRVKQWMLEIEKQEKQQEGFLFTDIPEFDKKAWEKILEERGLQGLA